MKTHEVSFTFKGAMAFHHVENSFYCGGGYLNGEYFANFRRILPNGEAIELQKIPTPKAYSAMTLWKQKSSLLTLGGEYGQRLK